MSTQPMYSVPMNTHRNDPSPIRLIKLAAIREPGYPQGQSAPCWFHCPCGDKVPAFQGEQTCTCGQKYDSRGWLVA